MPSPDLSNWLTKAEAATHLQISERTLDRRCDAGTGPERRERPRPGLKPEPVFNPDDVARLAAPKAHVMPPADFGIEPATLPAPARKHESQIARQPAPNDVLSLVLDRIAGAMEAKMQPPALYLTLPEARAYSGLSLALLRRHVKQGKLPSILDGATKVRRVDLDNFVNTSPNRQVLAKSTAR